jgi:hypothetical protein
VARQGPPHAGTVLGGSASSTPWRLSAAKILFQISDLFRIGRLKYHGGNQWQILIVDRCSGLGVVATTFVSAL